MNAFFKYLADHYVKPSVDAGIATLTAEKTANLAIIDADIAAGTSAIDAVANLVVGKVKLSNPLEQGIEDIVAPELLGDLNAQLETVDPSVDAYVEKLYDEALAWLVKEDSYL